MKGELSRRVKFAETLEINDFRRFLFLDYLEIHSIYHTQQLKGRSEVYKTINYRLDEFHTQVQRF